MYIRVHIYMHIHTYIYICINTHALLKASNQMVMIVLKLS